MGCDKIQGQLSAYLDGALSPAEKDIIDNHLRSCPKCREALVGLEMTVRSIKGLDEIIPPPWLSQKIMTKIKTETQRKERSLLQKLFYPLYIKLPLEAVGVFLVAITAIYFFKGMEPELKTRIIPSEETVSEYAAKRKKLKPGTGAKKQSQSPVSTISKKDETSAGTPSLQERGQLPASLPQQSIYDRELPVKERDSGELRVPDKDMLMKNSPSPAGLTAPEELKQERASLSAGKTISGFTEKEDISLSFKARDTQSAKKELEDVLSELGGRVNREDQTSDILIIIGELPSDKLLPLMRKLKTLGYVKERTPTPMSDKDRVLIKISVSGH